MQSTLVIVHTLEGRGEGDFASARARDRNSGVLERKKIFCLETYEMICDYAKISFLRGLKQKILMFTHS